MLEINNEGEVYGISPLDGVAVLLDDRDLYHCMFQPFLLHEDFTFSSFFKMIKKYPVFSKFFQTAISYLQEYENSLPDIDPTPNKKIAIITPNVLLNNGVMTYSKNMEVYILNEEASLCTDDVSSMYLKDYANYRLGMNTVALLDTIDENGTLVSMYLDYYIQKEFSLLNFVEFILSNISLHGFVEERNTVIHEIEVEKKEFDEFLETESKEIAHDILNKIKYGDKNDKNN